MNITVMGSVCTQFLYILKFKVSVLVHEVLMWVSLFLLNERVGSEGNYFCSQVNYFFRYKLVNINLLCMVLEKKTNLV